MRKTLLIGGGGHARSVIEAMGPDRFAGYVALTPAPVPLSLPYLGSDVQAVDEFSPDDYDVHIAIGFDAHGTLRLRSKMIEAYAGFKAPALIAPSALVTPMSTVGGGTAVMSRAVVNRSNVGCHCVINTGAIVEHDCHIADNVFIGPGAILCGEVTVGRNVFIGAGAVLHQGLHIPDSTVLGMGAVVISSPAVSGTYVGNPARLILNTNR